MCVWLWSCLLPARPLVAPSTALEVLVSPPALVPMYLTLASGQGWCAWCGKLGPLQGLYECRSFHATR